MLNLPGRGEGGRTQLILKIVCALIGLASVNSNRLQMSSATDNLVLASSAAKPLRMKTGSER